MFSQSIKNVFGCRLFCLQFKFIFLISPRIIPTETGMNELAKLSRDDNYIYNDVMDQIAHTKETLHEAKRSTDNKNLQEKLLMQDVKVENLKQTLDLKSKQLQELNELLKRRRADIGQLQNQRSYNFEVVVAEVFKDAKKFSSKTGHEISQTLHSLGLEIEYVESAVIKVQKDGKWFKLGLNDKLKLTLIDMNPRHSRFAEIKNLFDETRNIAGLFSIYGWAGL